MEELGRNLVAGLHIGAMMTLRRYDGSKVVFTWAEEEWFLWFLASNDAKS